MITRVFVTYISYKDKEGLMTMYNLGKNMAWLLNCIALGRQNGLTHPENEKVLTSFIR